MDVAAIKDGKLVTTLKSGKEMAVASANLRYDGTYRWFPLLPGRKGGRKTHSTEEGALRQAAKTLGYRVADA